jgi:hypothetical protein|tara:strand:- start:939 stop:1088 length:150 start_codon:yes stop_codon:yes gene_type:complete
MKRQRIETYLGKRKYDEFVTGVSNKKEKIIYDHVVIDKQNAKYSEYLFF